MGIASLTLGITGLFTWIVPILGFPISTAGLILGLLTLWLSKLRRGMALAGVILCVIGIVLNIVAMMLGIAISILAEVYPELFGM